MAVQIGGGNGVVTSNRETSATDDRQMEGLRLLHYLRKYPAEIVSQSRDLVDILSHPQLSREELQLIKILDFSGCRKTTRYELGMIPIAGETRSVIFDHAIQNIASLASQIQSGTRNSNRSQGGSDSYLDVKLEAFVNILKHLQLTPGREFGFSDKTLNRIFKNLLTLIEDRQGMEKFAALLLPLRDKASPEIAKRITSVAPTTNLYF